MLLMCAGTAHAEVASTTEAAPIAETELLGTWAMETESESVILDIRSYETRSDRGLRDRFTFDITDSMTGEIIDQDLLGYVKGKDVFLTTSMSKNGNVGLIHILMNEQLTSGSLTRILYYLTDCIFRVGMHPRDRQKACDASPKPETTKSYKSVGALYKL